MRMAGLRLFFTVVFNILEEIYFTFLFHLESLFSLNISLQTHEHIYQYKQLIMIAFYARVMSTLLNGKIITLNSKLNDFCRYIIEIFLRLIRIWIAYL